VSLRPFAALALALGLAPAAFSAPAPDLSLRVDDLRIEQGGDSGYHLYVRAKSGIGSVLLTESTRDPANAVDSFAFRSLERNPVNEGEARVLDGKKLPTEGEHRYLVDSTPEPDPAFGVAYHIFIPWVVAWGHSWSRSGKIYIHDGTFINIMTFAKPFADYSGAFADNPYLVRVTQAARPAAAPKAAPAPAASAPTPAVAPAPAEAAPNLGLYFPETLAAFGILAAQTKGQLRYASTDADILAQIDAILARLANAQGKSLDLVLCVDATDSMLNAADELKAKLPALLARRCARFSPARFGLVSYKDYFEEYLYKRQNFQDSPKAFAADLDTLNCGGGRDIPEAVYEALYASLREFPWSAEARIVILVGDAPPHPFPRGSIGEADVLDAAVSEGVELFPVAVPK
jgi:hypothetical protein